MAAYKDVCDRSPSNHKQIYVKRLIALPGPDAVQHAVSRRPLPVKGGKEGTCPFKSAQSNRIQQPRASEERINLGIDTFYPPGKFGSLSAPPPHEGKLGRALALSSPPSRI
ncbi:hypothetical protein IEQ34_005029 [Dendrobium chrysotoxum]|uniref:Uncharacterized protein n=1 Tax=Dendrobium chrysotoxum TaxID=161865 RepID=A0AAV7H701_DENCH|nr:hypothetical protein IEQ34_005029 [Dendrobium chrysotoxum]